MPRSSGRSCLSTAANLRTAALPLCVIFGMLVLPAVSMADEATDAQRMKFFESKVRPLLAAKCVQCHGETQQEGELRLDSLAAATKGGESGPAVTPGKPDESLLVEAVNYESFEMPPSGQLDAESIAVLIRWVEMGAPWPDTKDHLIRAGRKEFTDEDRSWWAVQPVREPEVPNAGATWGRNHIDRFVARKLDEAGLKPAPEAGRRELVRRAYFDLHGLPPTPDQVAAFVNDPRPDAWQQLIRELLDSPRYGERWAQHWLDVVRYAESDGYNEDAFRPSASAFRDYVIRSLNDDKPYNQLVREHLAGDEIDPGNPDVFIGTAYLRHGVYEWNQRNARMHWDLIVNEMTRVTGEAFLGIGIGCAQCHDHKFDPILQKDYFSLQAFLSSVAWPLDADLATPQQIAAHREKQQAWDEATREIRDEMHSLAEAAFDSNQDYTVRQFPDDVQAVYHKPESEKTTYEKQLSYLVQRQAKRAADRFDYVKALKGKPEKLKRYQELQVELKKSDSLKPEPLPDAFVATDMGSEPAPAWLLTRTTKEAVEPAFLALLGEGPPQITPNETTTGRRTALANWIARDDNPLSTRVIVNRVWQRHFGKGIVPTSNDFGTLGEPPSHPELLDWLTRRFLEGGWKIKPLHELIMNSAAYRQTARREPSVGQASSLPISDQNAIDRLEACPTVADRLEACPTTIDPDNRLLWRFPPQRLDAEQVRDAMLAVSGELNMREGGPSVAGTSPYRSVYVKKLRNKPDEMLSGFDAPLCFESAPDRIATTTPIQSLLLVNGEWSLARSRSFAKRLLSGQSQLEPGDIREAYRLVFGRDATEGEIREALEFVRGQAETIVEAPAVIDKYPDETGLRPVAQHFGAIKDLPLGEQTLWLQPGSRFERLEVQQAEGLGDEFTVEAVTILERIYPNANVNTLLSRWTGGATTDGWNIGVTSEKSAYQPRNFIVQLVGRTFQDKPAYEVVASGLRFPLDKPVYIAASISASTSSDNPTSGKVTFYMKDLSDPQAEVETAVVETSVVSRIQNPAAKIVTGGRTRLGSQWDGQLARLTVSRGALPREQLLIGSDFAKASRVLDWTFNGSDGKRPAPDTAWLREMPQDATHGIPPRMLDAVTDFCHTLFNSNEFLYLH